MSDSCDLVLEDVEGKPWTSEQEKQLKDLVEAKTTLAVIAQILGKPEALPSMPPFPESLPFWHHTSYNTFGNDCERLRSFSYFVE